MINLARWEHFGISTGCALNVIQQPFKDPLPTTQPFDSFDSPWFNHDLYKHFITNHDVVQRSIWMPLPFFSTTSTGPKGNGTHPALGVHSTTKCSDAGRTAKTRCLFEPFVSTLGSWNIVETLWHFCSCWLGIGYFLVVYFKVCFFLWSTGCCIGSFSSMHQSKRGTPQCCHLGNQISWGKLKRNTVHLKMKPIFKMIIGRLI